MSQIIWDLWAHVFYTYRNRKAAGDELDALAIEMAVLRGRHDFGHLSSEAWEPLRVELLALELRYREELP